jgi:transcriptional antiterminator RfaH
MPSGRKIASLIPLFPGYLFLLGEDRHRVEAMKGNHLVSVLDVADQAGLERDLSQIHRMLSSGLPVASDPTHPVGARIRITCGPLEGLVGTVVRRQGQGHRFVAVVAFLNRGASVELKDWEAELIDPPPVPSEGPRPWREMHAGRPAAARDDRPRRGGRPTVPAASPA